VVPDERAFPARPFWEDFGARGLRSCVVDVPLVLRTPERFAGAYVGGWGTHDPGVTGSYPPRLWRDLRRQFGARTMPGENFGPQTVRSLSQLSSELVRTTEQLRNMGAHLLRREAWNFACIVLAATHRAGHYLWDHSQAGDAARNAGPPAELEGMLERVYSAVDEAVGELVAAAGDDAQIVVFSLHGMDANDGWSEIVPGMLDSRRAALSQRPARKGVLYTLRRSLVTRLRPVLQHVPPALSARLVPLWSARMFDWQNTRSFPLPMDLNAFLRINLRGRERDGIVAPGADYEAACAELETFFGSLRDATTDRPIVAEILRAYATTPVEAPQRSGQPDLIVRWNDIRTRDVSRLRSATLPKFSCDVPELLPSGRSGNHKPLGWFVASGPGIAAGDTLGTHDILDLAPTVRTLLGLEPDATLHGHALPLVSALQ
jgi:predicted AlkP superfamily phosphohydrolase/phosphomutase